MIKYYICESSDNMEFLNDIKDETILIVPVNLKNKILEYIDKLDHLVNVKLYSLNEIKERLYFEYNEDSVLYLMNKLNCKYEVALTLIKNMYYVDDIIYSSEKLNNLVQLKKELLSLSLFKDDPLFFPFLKNKQIIVYGYDVLDKFEKKMLSCCNNITFIDIKSSTKPLLVYENETLFDEVNFVFEQISNLIEKGVDINKIKITNVDGSYHHALRIFSRFYNIPIAIDFVFPLNSTVIGKKFISILNGCNSLEGAVSLFNQMLDINETNANLYNKIFSICNKYIAVNSSFSSIKEGIIYHMKNTSISSSNLENKVEIVPFKNNVFEDDEYIFFVGFNQGSTPFIYKDEDYISDNLKQELTLSLTNEKNSLNKIAFVNKLHSIKNLIISYKLKSISEEYYPSNLINELSMEVIIPEISIKYSHTYSEIVLGSMLDDLIKYDVKNKNLDKYYNSISIPYMEYDNQFTGITKESLLAKLNNKLLLSYSTIDNYYRCGFRYYISNILKLDKYEETFKTFIGNLFHYILSKCLEENFCFDLEWDNYIKEKNFSVSESFFLIKLKGELTLIIKEVKRLHNATGLTNNMFEQKIYIDKSRDIPVTFMGIVDKIMYKNISGEDLISIIDYKTGNPNTNLFNTIYGIDMQLPVYLYLVKYSTLFNNPTFVGFYLQKILHGEINRSPSKSYLEQKQDNLKLSGYSNVREDVLSRFDPSYENSEFIRSMRVTSKGFYTYAKVIEDERIKLLIDLVNSKIDNAIDDILSCKFDINPKRVGLDNIGCMFCKYKDLCYMKEENIINLKEYKDFSFLGGDNNA